MSSLAPLIALLLVIFLITSHAVARAAPTQPTITAYTMPWCGACKRLQPEWDRLNSMASADIAVVQVDCTKGNCRKCSHYPTIISNNVEYKGARTAEAMHAWAMEVNL